MSYDKTFIIAEAGVNHNGSLEIAKRLVDVAAESGADAVKFQTFKGENLACKNADKADYQKKTTSTEESQLEMLRRLELGGNNHKILFKYCSEKNIQFLSSPFDLEGIDLLNALGVEIFKIPSGEIINLPYLRKIGSLRKRIILSTGMADLGEIEDALDILVSAGTSRENITVLHCSTEYPTSLDDVNLRAMSTIGRTFQVKVGYSDHTLGIEVPIAAVALGASVIEKHFTLDKNMDGPDHKASLDPLELSEMVRAIRHIEKALGDGVKKPSIGEMKNIAIIRKSIVASRVITKGEVFTENNLAVKRTGKAGVSPMYWDEIIGKRALEDYGPDDQIEPW